MTSGPVEKSKELHSDPNYSLPSGYVLNNTLKGRMRLPFALKTTYSSFAVKDFLDYGCGKNGLINLLKTQKDFQSINFVGYDPAVSEFSAKPNKTFDIVTCIDVLEHISRYEMSRTLADIDKLTHGFFFFAIDLIPAKKTLSDSRNAHIMIAPADWWCQQISSQFSYTRFFQPGKFKSGEKFPIHLFGWATNFAESQKMANMFFETIEIFSKEWILDDKKYTAITGV